MDVITEDEDRISRGSKQEMSFGSGINIGYEAVTPSVRNRMNTLVANPGVGGVIRMPNGFQSMAIPSIREVPEKEETKTT